jgi:alkylation response protein AidB-like acyl-CoA dehydrogenase
LIAVGNECAASFGYLPAAVADEMLGGEADLIIAGALKSRHAELEVVDGGYRLRGQWMLASGCPEASWFGAAALVSESARGRPDLRLFMLPSSDCRILETWDALGLRATASHDFEVPDAFVPAEGCFPFAGARSELPGALWRGDFRSHLGGVAAVALGTARAAIDELLALAVEKVPFLGTSTLRDRGNVQANVGRAEGLVRSGRAFLYEVLAEMWHTQSRGDDVTKEELALRDLAALNAVQSSARAVELMYDSAGSTAVYATSTLERCFRDVHTITQHIVGAASRYEPLGRFLIELRQESGPLTL